MLLNRLAGCYDSLLCGFFDFSTLEKDTLLDLRSQVLVSKYVHDFRLEIWGIFHQSGSLISCVAILIMCLHALMDR